MSNSLLQEILDGSPILLPGGALPRIFEHIFQCAPDVNDTALETGQPLEKVDQIARNVTLYHNRQYVAMVISDYTSGQSERLAGARSAHPAALQTRSRK